MSPRRPLPAFRHIAGVAALLLAAALPVSAQVRTLKVGIGLSEDHPRAWR